MGNLAHFEHFLTWIIPYIHKHQGASAIARAKGAQTRAGAETPGPLTLTIA